MPVPSNPTLRDIWAEYGGSGTLRQYVRGGALVPIGSSAGISTNASELTLRQFAGTTKPLSLNFTTTMTASVGSLEVIKADDIIVYGYLDQNYPNFGGGVSPAGSLSNSTISGINSQVLLLGITSGYGDQLEFSISGDHSTVLWNTLTFYHNFSGATATFNRPGNGSVLDGDNPMTTWAMASSNFINTQAGQNTYQITVA